MEQQTLVRARTFGEYAVALARAEYAADRNAQREGRRVWNREDADVAQREMERQWRDKQ